MGCSTSDSSDNDMHMSTKTTRTPIQHQSEYKQILQEWHIPRPSNTSYISPHGFYKIGITQKDIAKINEITNQSNDNDSSMGDLLLDIGHTITHHQESFIQWTWIELDIILNDIDINQLDEYKIFCNSIKCCGGPVKIERIVIAIAPSLISKLEISKAKFAQLLSRDVFIDSLRSPIARPYSVFFASNILDLLPGKASSSKELRVKMQKNHLWFSCIGANIRNYKLTVYQDKFTNNEAAYIPFSPNEESRTTFYKSIRNKTDEISTIIEHNIDTYLRPVLEEKKIDIDDVSAANRFVETLMNKSKCNNDYTHGISLIMKQTYVRLYYLLLNPRSIYIANIMNGLESDNKNHYKQTIKHLLYIIPKNIKQIIWKYKPDFNVSIHNCDEFAPAQTAFKYEYNADPEVDDIELNQATTIVMYIQLGLSEMLLPFYTQTLYHEYVGYFKHYRHAIQFVMYYNFKLKQKAGIYEEGKLFVGYRIDSELDRCFCYKINEDTKCVLNASKICDLFNKNYKSLSTKDLYKEFQSFYEKKDVEVELPQRCHPCIFYETDSLEF